MSKILAFPITIIVAVLSHEYVIDNPILETSEANEALAVFMFLAILATGIMMIIDTG